MIHCTDIIIRGYHLDLYNHVNNARYLELLEEARWSLLDGRLNLNEWQQRGLGFTIVNININYRYPAGLSAVLSFYAHLKRMGERSATLYQVAYLKDTETVVIDAEVTFVIANLDSGKAIPLAGELRETLSGLLPKELAHEA